MKAISLHQPWASAVVIGIKRYETRSRPIRLRGTFAIHASARRHVDDKYAFEELLENPDIYEAFENALELDYECLQFGSIIGTVEFKLCCPTAEIRPWLSETERLLGNYDEGRFAILLENPVWFSRAIPCRGHQFIWTLPSEIVSQFPSAPSAPSAVKTVPSV